MARPLLLAVSWIAVHGLLLLPRADAAVPRRIAKQDDISSGAFTQETTTNAAEASSGQAIPTTTNTSRATITSSTSSSCNPTVLHDNGPLVTSVGDGAGGSNLSTLINPPLSTFGAGAQRVSNNAIADDFTVPAGSPWVVSRFVFFAYQSGSTTTSTITNAYISLFNGKPGFGGVPISMAAGPQVTLVGVPFTQCASVTSNWTGTYRVVNGSSGNTQRPIMRVECTVPGGSITFQPSTNVWVAVTLEGSLASGPWIPPVTIPGQNVTGDSVQFTGGVWANFLDGLGPQQGMPFQVVRCGPSGPSFPFCNCNRTAAANPWEAQVVNETQSSNATDYVIRFTVNPSKSQQVVPLVKFELGFPDRSASRLFFTSLDRRFLGGVATSFSEEQRGPVVKFTNINVTHSAGSAELRFRVRGRTLSQLCGGTVCNYALFGTKGTGGACTVGTLSVRA